MKNKIISILLAILMVFSMSACKTSIEEQFTIQSPAPTVPQETQSDQMQDLPSTYGDTLREKTVAYAREMAQIGWFTDDDIDFSCAKSWTPNLRYYHNVPYHGLPYTSDRISANGNLDEFQACVNAETLYFGEKTYNEMPGTDCGGVLRLAYAYAGVLENQELEMMVFDPNSGEKNCGLIPLGDYDVSEYTRDVSTKAQICDKNGMDKMLECYAELQPGDCLFNLYDGGGEHIVLITQPSAVEQTENGEYFPELCTVQVLEQNADLHEFETYWSNWNEHSLTFAELFNAGYIPFTMQQFSKTEQDPAQYSLELADFENTCTFHDLLKGQVHCNYNIFSLSAVITDENGEIVCEGISYPNSLVADLCELDYGEKLLQMPSGNYHLTISAKTGLGSQDVADFDISYEQQTDLPVIYISDHGTGNGTSAENALGNAPDYETITQMSYKHSALYRAVCMLAHTGGTIVVCDDVNLISGRCLERYTGIATCFSAPSYTSHQNIVLTSNDGTTDFRAQNGAELIMKKTEDQAVDLELCIATTWRDIDITLNYDFPDELPTGKWPFVSCGNEKTVFENSVGVNLQKCGEALDAEEYKMLLPNLYGGYFYGGTFGSTDLTVNGGTWGSVIGGSGCCSLIGDSNLTIGEKAVVMNGVYGGGDDPGEGAMGGNVHVAISGGKFGGDLYISGTSNYVREDCTCAWTVSGAPDFGGVQNVFAGTLDPTLISLDISGTQTAEILRNPEVFGSILG